MTDRSTDNLLRLAAVKARTGMSRTLIYKRTGEASFPRSPMTAACLVTVQKATK